MPNYAPTLRVLRTTRAHWVPGFSDMTIEDHPILAAMKSKGQIDYDCTGTQYEETLKYKRNTLSGYTDMQRLNWARHNNKLKMYLPVRGLKMTDIVSDLEMRMNSGKEAIAREFAKKLNDMGQDASDDFGKHLYYDGSATAYSTFLHGIQSFCSHSAGTSTDAFATTLDDTYGTLSTARAAYGGTVRGGGSPSGDNFESDDPEFDFFSPIMVNVTYDDGTTTHSWSQDAVKIIARAINHATRGKAKRHKLDLFTMSRADFLTFKDQLRGKERINVDPGPDRSLLVKLGFGNVVNIDGVDCIADPDMPSTTGGTTSVTTRAYGWNFDFLKLCLWGRPGASQKNVDGLWNASGDAWDEDEQIYKYWVGLWGNFVMYPRHFCEVAEYA